MKNYKFQVTLDVTGEVEAASRDEAYRIVERILDNVSDVRIVENLQVDGHPGDAEDFDDDLWVKPTRVILKGFGGPFG